MSANKKKILMLSTDYPFPEKCGFTVRLGDLCRNLANTFELHLMVYGDGNIKNPQNSALFSEIIFYRPRGISTARKIFNKFYLRLVRPYFDDRIYLDKDFIRLVQEKQDQNKYNICMAHTPLFAGCINALPDTVFKVVDTQDIWHQKYHEFRKYGCGRLLSHYRNKRREIEFYRKADLVLGISRWDYQYMVDNNINSIYVPVSFPAQPLNHDRQFNNEVLYPAGAGPHNLDAIKFFADEVMPIIKKDVPSLKFKILNPDSELKRLFHNRIDVEFIPFQDDIKKAYQQADLVVIPLRIKSGLKIKLLESFSYGMPAIISASASQGVELDGYAQKVFPATAPEFALATVKALSSAEYRKELSRSALRIISDHYQPAQVYAALIDKLKNSSARHEHR